MLKFEENENGMKMRVEGSTLDICVDTMVFLSTMYDELAKRGDESENFFYDTVKDNLIYVKDKEAFQKKVSENMNILNKVFDEKMEKVKELIKEISEIAKTMDEVEKAKGAKNEE